jgi:hypothetical protein
MNNFSKIFFNTNQLEKFISQIAFELTFFLSKTIILITITTEVLFIEIMNE